MTDLPLGLTPGCIVEIDGIAHIYERCDPDDRLTIRREKGTVEFRLPARRRASGKSQRHGS